MYSIWELIDKTHEGGFIDSRWQFPEIIDLICDHPRRPVRVYHFPAWPEDEPKKWLLDFRGQNADTDVVKLRRDLLNIMRERGIT